MPSSAHCAFSHAIASNGPSPKWLSHQSDASPNGSWTNHRVTRITMPATIALEMRPSPIARMLGGSRHASTASAPSDASVPASQSS